MHWVDFEGRRLPKRIGGHPALDFCNTRAGWNEPPGHHGEWLADYATLLAWTKYAGLIDDDVADGLEGVDDEATLEAARRLRAAAYAVLLDREDARAFAEVASVARQAARALVLEPGDGGVASWKLACAGPETALLAPARAVADLLTRHERTAVRACPGDGCGWLFLDTRGRRKWCIMAICGNRAKVRAHASRQRTRDATP